MSEPRSTHAARALSPVRRVLAHVEENVAERRDRGACEARVPFLREVIPPAGVGAEIGVFKGRFSPVLLRETRAVQLHLIDPWYLLTPEWHWGRGDRSTVNALRRILGRFRPEIEAGTVVVHIGDDREVLARFPDATFDWVYLDSSHAYEHTRQELAILRRKVKPGGLIAGDDWRPAPAHPHHGVFRAVQELVSEPGWALIHADEQTLQWAVRLPGPG
jgi:SAM-dependent methyltransferase